MNKNLVYRIVCIIELILLIAVMCLYCRYDGVRADEVFTIGFSNSSRTTFLSEGIFEQDGHNGWLPGDYIRSYLSIDEGERFNPIVPARNARADVHPPLYFIMVNVMYSFCPGYAGALPGHILQIIWGIVIVVFLYLITRRIVKDKIVALITPVLWMLSDVGFAMTTYIRMYIALAAMVLVSLYIYTLLFEDGKKKKTYVALAAVSCVGTWIHYYFIIYCILSAILFGIYLLIKKRSKDVIGLSLSMVAAAGVSIVVWPYSIKHLLYSDRGMEATGYLASTDGSWYTALLKEYVKLINDSAFNGRFLIYLVVFTVCVLGLFAVKKCFKTKISEGEATYFTPLGKEICVYIVICMIAYLAILFKISYSCKSTYTIPFFVMFDIVLVTLAGKVLCSISKTGGEVTLGAIVAVLGVIYLIQNMNYTAELYNTRKSVASDIVANTADADVIFINEEWNPTADNHLYELQAYDEVYMLDRDSLDAADYSDIIEGRATDGELRLFMDPYMPERDEIVNDVATAYGARDTEVVSWYEYVVYRFVK
ncbi:MAG: hypothetical protein KBT19_08240 [Lachnospiraceae bacterium]|nr:hypothetical protein [Candidatus Colinaster equi]